MGTTTIPAAAATATHPTLPTACLCRRPLLLEVGESSAAPLMLQSAEQLKRGGDFIPGFKKSDQQVGVRGRGPVTQLGSLHGGHGRRRGKACIWLP